MTPQSAQSQDFSSALAPHLHFDLEACPTCGQEIPPDRLEEISGRIAAKEREQAIAIAAQLERKFAIERASTEAKAKAELELERQQGAARVACAREEAQEAAQKLVSQMQAEAEQAKAELEAGWQQRLAGAESARKTAEQTEANLKAEMKELREAGARALEVAKAEAKERELEIRNEAKRTADLAAAESVAALEAAQRESESAFQARIDEAEAGRISALGKETALMAQIDELRLAKEAEVTKVREEAEAASLLVLRATEEAAEARFRETIAAHEKAADDASARARDAEARVLNLTTEHASALEKSLSTQREVLEKAKDDAVNAERAKAFEEGQKLSTKVNELQRALEKKTNEELGEGAEVDLFEALRAEFPDDKIARIAKGAPGADIHHVVMLHGKECGTILYDSKNHKQFRNDHVAKLRTDQLAERAEHAILSTHKFPQGTGQVHLQDGVVLANPARVVSIATILRQHLQQLHMLRLSGIEREGKTAALYEFITSVHCADLLGRIDQRAEDLFGIQEKEMKWHEGNWRKQGEAIRAIQKAKADLASQIDSIVGTAADDSAMEEVS